MENQSNGKTITAFVLGIIACAMALFGIYGSIIGLVCGIIGLVLSIKVKKTNPSSMATAAFVLSIVGTVLCTVMFLACACLIGGLASLGTVD